MISGAEHFRCLKHFDLCFYWLQDVRHTGMIDPYICFTEDMPADILTKLLQHMKMLNLGDKLDQRRKDIVTLQSELSSYIVERHTKYLPAV